MKKPNEKGDNRYFLMNMNTQNKFEKNFFENNKFDRNKKYGEVLIEHGMIGIPILLTKYKLNSNLSIGNAKDIIDSFDLIKDLVDYEYSNYLPDIINICNESIENNIIITIDYLHDDSSKKTN